MYIIAGLGNPDKQYMKTRHNVGFDTIDYISDKYNIPVVEGKFKAVIGKGVMEGQKVILVKPLTYMNLSGESLRMVVDYYKVDPEAELIVISDDISLDVGYIRVRPKGSAGGHNGLKNIIQNLGTEKFCRVRVGVGDKPKDYDLADYVLGHFSKEDRVEVDKAIKDAADAIACVMNEGADTAMNRYNKKKEAPKNNLI